MTPDELPVTSAPAPTGPGMPAENNLGVTGCWSDSGVYGNGTCPELQKFVHCRNCPVYSAAGLRLLDRPLPANYRQEWTQHFAQERRLPDSGNASLILFRIQSHWFALSTRSFQEVAEKRPIHSLPHRRGGFVLGLANVRGELVVCISVGHLLKMGSLPSMGTLRNQYQRLLVVQSDTNRLAFPVDEVDGPHRFEAQDLKRVPAPPEGMAHHFVRARLQWQDRTAGFLDPDQLFASLSPGQP